MIEVLEYAFFMLFRKIARNLPYQVVGRLGELLGTLMYRVVGYRKRLALENIGYAFPELDWKAKKQIALGAFKNYGASVLHMLWADGQTEQTLLKTVWIPDRTPLERCLEKRKGVIILSGHYGSWEFIVHGLRLHIGRPMGIIVQRQRNKKIDSIIDRGRRRHNNVTIPMGPSSREALKILHEGGVLALLGDQSGPRESAFVDFFGRPAATHRGVAAFSLKTGAPIVMVFLIRQPDWTYLAVFEEVDSSDLHDSSEENIIELTRRHTKLLEKYIRLHPDHWLWMHKRWKHTQEYETARKATATL